MTNRFKNAIDKGDIELVRSMLADNPELASSPIRWGGTLSLCITEPLHYLSDAPFNQLWDHGRQAQLAAVLIEAGTPVNGLPTSGETPLHGAASPGEADVAEVLIDKGASMEAIAEYPGIPDGTPLDFAVHFGMVDVVDVLVKTGAAILSTRMAAGAGQVDRVKAEIPSLDHHSETLLDIFRCAVVCDQAPVVEVLLNHGIDVNVPVDGATALHWAAWEAKPDMVRYLLSQGADSSLQDDEHKSTALDWAKHRGQQLGPRWGHSEVVSVLC